MSYIYGTSDLSLYSYGFSDPIYLESMATDLFSLPTDKTTSHSSSCSSHRHDGTSPLPLGIDWSPPPRTWDGRNSIWPHDPHTGWSYCVTVPSWILLPTSAGSHHVVFYRVQIGIQSPEGITTIHGVLRRFNDFLKLFSDLKNDFPDKDLPPAPPRRLLRMKNSSLLDERKCALEDWMEKLLSDIDLSRTIHVAIFLELEAAVRSSFDDSNKISSAENLPANLPADSDASLGAGSSSVSDLGSDYAYETSELGRPRSWRENEFKVGILNPTSNQDKSCKLETSGDNLTGKGDGQLMDDSIQNLQMRLSQHKVLFRRDDSGMEDEDVTGSTSLAVSNCEDGKESYSKCESCELGKHVLVHTVENMCVLLEAANFKSEVTNSFSDNSLKFSEGAEASTSMVLPVGSDLHIPSDFFVALPLEDRNKVNRVFLTMQQRLETANTDMEDLIARLNQELAIKQYLTTKIKDLEVELETSKQRGKENLQLVILNERDKFTQLQWAAEDFRKKCMELELRLKSEQDEKMLIESTNLSITRQNKSLLQDLDVTREKFENLLKHQEEIELKAKSDVKLLIKEVKALRSSQKELKHEVIRLTEEKLVGEPSKKRTSSVFLRVLHQEKQRSGQADAAHVKLLHESEVLHSHREECCINSLVVEEHKLTRDTSSTSESDAVHLSSSCGAPPTS